MGESDLVEGGIRAFLTGVPSIWRTWQLRRKKKQALRTLLRDDTYIWRTTEALQNAIAATREETEELLLDIRARRSGDGRDLWTIKK